MRAFYSRQSIVFIFFATIVFWQGATAAGDTDPKVHKKKLERVRVQIKSIQKTLGLIESERNSVIGQLKTIERQYGQIAKSLEGLQTQSMALRQRLASIKARIGTLRTSVKQQGEMLADQLRSAYMMGREDRLKLLLNQDDPTRISRLLLYYEYLNRDRVLKLSNYQSELNELGRIENEHLRKSKQLAALLGRKKNEQKNLEQVRSTRNQVLASLDRELKNKGDKLSHLKANEQKITNLLLSIQRIMENFPLDESPSLPFHKMRGRLTWPVNGKLIKRFGARRIGGRWDGVLIGATEGTPVRAISRGRVAYSDWLRGYGFITILDHGDGYMTLYAFNQSLYKEVGDWVDTGEVIASVGRSGGRSKPGLYFGIRKSGEPINPLTWCKRVRGGRVG